MKHLFENWQTFLKEETSHYEMHVSLRADPDTQVYGSVFDKIRAIPGITIVKSTKSAEKDRYGNKLINLSLKFLMVPGAGEEYIPFLKRELQKIKDAEGDRITGVRITKLPQKTTK
tara:strand:- start:74523 stop:74870 length:348 start_codon:yes stop_codon:yes gene_type:complete